MSSPEQTLKIILGDVEISLPQDLPFQYSPKDSLAIDLSAGCRGILRIKAGKTSCIATYTSFLIMLLRAFLGLVCRVSRMLICSNGQAKKPEPTAPLPHCPKRQQCACDRPKAEGKQHLNELPAVRNIAFLLLYQGVCTSQVESKPVSSPQNGIPAPCKHQKQFSHSRRQ